MLQELTENTGAVLLAIGSTLFFLVVFLVVALRVLTRKAGSYDAAARLPLEEAPPARGDGRSAAHGNSSTGGR